MSFILDALRKSENERQEQLSAEFSTASGASGSARAPRWLWIFGTLLAINIVVVAGLMLRPAPSTPTDRTPPVAAGTAETAVPDRPSEPVAATPSFADRVEVARRSQPPVAIATERDASLDAPAEPAPAAPRSQFASPDPGIAALPTLQELQVSGGVSLPPLHIDLHVYNEDPARRFVSVNMNKYRENEQLREGPTVRSITREGVILEYQGRSFALLQ